MEKRQTFNESQHLPNFLMVGAPKCGTTSLYYYLDQHPKIYMSPAKEPHFFSTVHPDTERIARQMHPHPLTNFIRDIHRYRELFSGATGEKAIGEGSTSYLYYGDLSIANIKRLIPNWQDLKILIIVRNPIEASYSHYLMYRSTGKEPLSLPEAFADEPRRISEGYLTLAHFDRFRYVPQIRRYMENFSRVKVLLFDDLKKNLPILLKDVFRFLAVDSNFIPPVLDKINATGIPRHQWLHNMLFKDNSFKRALRPVIRLLVPKMQRAVLKERIKVKNISKPPMSEDMHKILSEYFREDIVQLQDVIGRDLTHWLNGTSEERNEAQTKCNTIT